MIISTGQISNKKIDELLKALISKYILTDEEILSSFCKKGTKRYQGNFKYHRGTSNNDRFRVNYFVIMSGISILITLVYNDELTEAEKNFLKKYSSIKFD